MTGEALKRATNKANFTQSTKSMYLLVILVLMNMIQNNNNIYIYTIYKCSICPLLNKNSTINIKKVTSIIK